MAAAAPADGPDGLPPKDDGADDPAADLNLTVEASQPPQSSPRANAQPTPRLSPRAKARRAAAATRSQTASYQELEQLVQARLFGGDPNVHSASGALTERQACRSDPSSLGRLLSPRLRPPALLSEEHTFKPHISKKSRKLVTSSKEGGTPRWVVLARKHDNLKMQERVAKHAEEEERQCTFKPEISAKSDRICRQQQGKLSRWNTPPAQVSCSSPRGGASALSASVAESAGEGAGSDLAEASRQQLSKGATAEPDGGRGGSPAPPRPAAFHGGRHRDLYTGLAQNMLGSRDPVFQDLHRMLRSLKL